MPATAIRADRSEIESLLRLRKLDHTIVDRPSSIVHRPDGGRPDGGRPDGGRPDGGRPDGGRPDGGRPDGGRPDGGRPDDGRWPIDDGRSVPIGIPDLDARLEGGFPRGHLSEVTGPRSSGRLAILVSAMARATARGEAVALVDPLDMFDPVSASAALRQAQGRPEHGRGTAGLDFQRMLWVRGEATSSARVSLSCEYGTLQKALDRAVKALNIILQADGFGLVVLDLTEVAPQAIQRLPYTTWLRLSRVIEGSETACVLMGSAPIARSSGGVSVQLSRPKAQSLKPGALCIAHVVRSRAMEVDRNVCVSVSAAAC